jgi:tetratricopeptide (TPR) repeat protein
MNNFPKTALQNNIGALMLLKNSPSAAKERLYASIATNGIMSSSNKSLADLMPETICPKIDADPPGLVWFYNKLLREVSHCNPRNDELEVRVPLGLEYFHHPIQVRGSNDARTAAGINLALICFREAKHEIDDLINLLKWSIGLDVEESDNFDTTDVDPMLFAIAHSNIGVLRFMQHNMRAAMQNFIQANSILTKSIATGFHSADHPWSGITNLSMDYVQLTFILNHARTAIETDNDHSEQYCNDLFSTATAIRCCKSFYRIKWLVIVSTYYIPGLQHQNEEHFNRAFECYNTLLSIARKEWGHGHVHAAAILEKKGSVQFEQKRYQNALMSYLASWKVYQHAGYPLDESRLLYAIGRTLHDKEEFADALSMYNKSIALREQIEHTSKRMTIDTIQILCNICRVHHIMGDLQKALEANQHIMRLASDMVGGGETASSHAFVRNRMMVLGNLYVETGRLTDAMDIFSQVARSNRDGDWMVTSHARPEIEDVDTNAFAVRAAERLGNLGGRFKSHAAAA